MATPAQLTANRANAQRSTGPRSVEGKSVSRFNALKHGVDAASITLPGEDPRAYRALADSYDETYQPSTVIDRFLIDTMIRADWHKQRLQLVEADLIRKLLAETPGASLLDVMLSDSPAGKLLARVQRQIATHERVWYRAHRELVRLITNVVAAEQNGFPVGPAPLPNPEEFEEPKRTQRSASPAAKLWPPVDENTGRPQYFVG
jgi:hypothetical protein